MAREHELQLFALTHRAEAAERALAFDHIPVVGGVGGGQLFGGTGHEVGDHGVDGHALTCNHDAGLAGGAEGGGDQGFHRCLFPK